MRLAAIFVLLGALGCATAGGDRRAEDPDRFFERDRRAILAMIGEYEVTFTFDETVALAPGYELKPAQRSAGFEHVEIAADEGERILLRHYLVTRDGHVTKHWTQEWRYQDRTLLEFRGHRRWRKREVGKREAKGAWSQAVYEVDDGPRYEALGRWSHGGNVSAWTSDETWRPLPRREHTKRSDYEVLVAVNRQEIVPDGWVHEQDNLKLVLRGADPHALAREHGLNTYRRSSAVDFTPAVDYARETAGFWALVRQAWDARIEAAEELEIRERDGDKTLIEEALTMAEEAREVDAEGLAAFEPRIADLLERYTTSR